MTGMTNMPSASAELTADHLRKLWKLRRDTYAQAHLYEDVRIRVHRSLTWLAVAEARSGNEADTKLVELWCAAGALFSRWSALVGAPLPEREALGSFARQVMQWDRDGIMPKILDELRPSAAAMWSDPYLTRSLGMTAVGADAAKTTPLPTELPTEHGALFRGMLERIGLTVMQLSIGAATYGGNQNRVAVDRSVVALGALVPAFLHVITEHGYVDDWGPLCSPPRDEAPL